MCHFLSVLIDQLQRAVMSPLYLLPFVRQWCSKKAFFPSKSFVPNYPAPVTVMLPLFFTNNLTRTVCYVLIDTSPCRAELISYLSSKKKII